MAKHIVGNTFHIRIIEWMSLGDVILNINIKSNIQELFVIFMDL